MPLDGEFPISQWFGEDPKTYDYLNPPGHPGIDWACPEGTRVTAVAGGVVTHVGWDPDWPARGIHVKIDHGDGVTSMYMHLSRVGVEVGEDIPAGHLVGFSGNTAAPGWSTGPHLHLGRYEYGKPVDPAPFLGLVRPTS